MEEIKIVVWLAKDITLMRQNTRVHYGKPVLVDDYCFSINTPGKRAKAWKSKEFKLVENFIKPGECQKVEITIKKLDTDKGVPE